MFKLCLTLQCLQHFDDDCWTTGRTLSWKNKYWDVDPFFCLERCISLHMVHYMPLCLNFCCFCAVCFFTFSLYQRTQVTLKNVLKWMCEWLCSWNNDHSVIWFVCFCFILTEVKHILNECIYKFLQSIFVIILISNVKILFSPALDHPYNWSMTYLHDNYA